MRRHISNPSGNESYIDVPGDLDERTFAAMVERGDYTVLDGEPVPDSPFVSRTRTTHNVVPGAVNVVNERLGAGGPLRDGGPATVVEILSGGLSDGYVIADATPPATAVESISHGGELGDQTYSPGVEAAGGPDAAAAVLAGDLPATHTRPGDTASKAHWVDYAVDHGADRAEAEATTKADLVASYG